MAKGNYINKAAENVAAFKEDEAKPEITVSGRIRYGKKEKRISVVVSEAAHEYIENLKAAGLIKSSNAYINELIEKDMLKNTIK